MTGLRTIERALRLIGAIAPGEPVTPEEAADALEALQSMLNTWRTQSLLCYVVDYETITMTSGQASYTVGPGGDFDRARPVFAPYGISCIDNSNAAQPLELPAELLTVQQWEQIPTKNVQSRLFTRAFYRPTFPLAEILTWPIVNAGDVSMKIYVLTSIEGLDDLATEFEFAPGYEEAIVYNLAVRLGPEWGNEVPALVMRMAQDLLADVKRTNTVIDQLQVDPALLFRKQGLYNWRTDQNA